MSTSLQDDTIAWCKETMQSVEKAGQYIGQYSGWKQVAHGKEARIKMANPIQVGDTQYTLYFNIHDAWTAKPLLGSIFIAGIKGFWINCDSLDSPVPASLAKDMVDFGMSLMTEQQKKAAAPPPTQAESSASWRARPATPTPTPTPSSSGRYVPPHQRGTGGSGGPPKKSW